MEPGGAAEMEVVSATRRKGWEGRQRLTGRVGKRKVCRRHQFSKGLWYRAFKRSYGPFRHLRTVSVHLSIASHHYIGTTRPFMGWPLSAPSHVKCSAVVKSSQEEWCKILAPQRLIMVARGHSWQDLCLLLPRSGVEPWYRGSQSSDGPP